MISGDSFHLSAMQAKPISEQLWLYDEPMKNGRPSKSSQSNFALRLRALREAAGLSQRELARQLGISQPSYVAWESYNVALKAEQLTKLAEALGVTVEQLFEETATGKQQRGPAGRIRQVFEQVSKLPRSQQQRIIGVVEALVAQTANA
jgi:transcriptional regulator with XRE-family HTH domain